MIAKSFSQALYAWVRWGVALGLALSMVISLPAPQAQAAKKPEKNTGQHLANCGRVVKASPGDTIQKIAKKTHLDWRELARVNDINPHYPLETGTQVCLYNLAHRLAGQNASTAVSVAVASTSTLTVTTSSFLTSADFKVKTKVRGGELPPHTWQDLGYLKVPSHTDQTAIIHLPFRMGRTAAFDLCLKNQETDELLCQPITFQ